MVYPAWVTLALQPLPAWTPAAMLPLPVWLMLALFAFGYLFGFFGLLVAVPVAPAIGVLVRFALGRYRAAADPAGAL